MHYLNGQILFELLNCFVHGSNQFTNNEGRSEIVVVLNTQAFRRALALGLPLSNNENDNSERCIFIQLTGQWHLIASGFKVEISVRRTRALLSVLALEREIPHSRDALAKLFWDDAPRSKARASLRQVIREMRRVLGENIDGVLDISPETISVVDGALRSNLDDVIESIHSGTATNDVAGTVLQFDNLLAGYEGLGEAFSEWLEATRKRVVGRLTELLTAAYQNEAFDLESRLRFAEGVYRLDDLDERAARAMMTFHAGLDQMPMALRIYNELFARLEEELGAEPSPATQDLAVEIKLAEEGDFPAHSVATPPNVPALPQAARGVSIAVLPFEVLSPSPLPDYVALGILDEITCNLARFPEPAVISSNSTRRFVGAEKPTPAEIRRELGASYIVMGAIRCDEADARITVQVVEGATEKILWANVHDCRVAEILQIRNEIAQNITAAVAPSLHTAELQRTQTLQSDDLEPYHLLLRAKELIFEMSEVSFDEAKRLLELAVEKGPFFAPAYALYAEWCLISIWQGWSKDPGSHRATLEAYARKAISLAPDEGRTMAFFGHNRVILSREYDEAAVMFDRALKLLPNDSETLVWTVPSLAFSDRAPEAIDRGRRANALSPMDPFSFRNKHFLAIALYADGQFDEAVDLGLDCFATNPDYGSNTRTTIAALAATGRMEEARPLVDQHARLDADFRVGAYIDGHAFQSAQQKSVLGQRLISAGLPA